MFIPRLSHSYTKPNRHWEPRSDFPRASSPGKVPWVIQAVASHLSPQSYQPNEQPFTNKVSSHTKWSRPPQIRSEDPPILTYPGPVPFSSLTLNGSRWGLQMLYARCEIEGSRSRNQKTLTLKRFIDGLLAKQSFYLRRGGLSKVTGVTVLRRAADESRA